MYPLREDFENSVDFNSETFEVFETVTVNEVSKARQGNKGMSKTKTHVKPFDEIDLSHLSGPAQEGVKHLLTESQDIFSTGLSDIRRTDKNLSQDERLTLLIVFGHIMQMRIRQ
jgi:hypothetical protein